MSVGRDVVADMCGVPEYCVRCKKCNRAKAVKSGYHYNLLCSGWNHAKVRKDDFCSFYIPKKRRKNANKMPGLRPQISAEPYI